MAFRTDGLDNPLSPNSGLLTWAVVAKKCEESEAVKSYTDDGREIVWCDGNVSTHTDPQSAYNEICEMERC